MSFTRHLSRENVFTNNEETDKVRFTVLMASWLMELNGAKGRTGQRVAKFSVRTHKKKMLDGHKLRSQCKSSNRNTTMKTGPKKKMQEGIHGTQGHSSGT